MPALFSFLPAPQGPEGPQLPQHPVYIGQIEPATLANGRIKQEVLQEVQVVSCCF